MTNVTGTSTRSSFPVIIPDWEDLFLFVEEGSSAKYLVCSKIVHTLIRYNLDTCY